MALDDLLISGVPYKIRIVPDELGWHKTCRVRSSWR